jgi:hypothetical protein
MEYFCDRFFLFNYYVFILSFQRENMNALFVCQLLRCVEHVVLVSIYL